MKIGKLGIAPTFHIDYPRESLAALVTLVIYAVGATIGSFAGGSWGGLGIGCGLILFAICYAKDRALPLPDPALTYLALAALFVMAMLNFHSSNPHISWHQWLSLATIFIPLLLLSNSEIAARAWHPSFVPVIFIALIAAALTLGTDLSLYTPLLYAVEGPSAAATDYNRGMSGLVLLSFPVMAGLMRGNFPLGDNKRIWMLLFFVVILLFPAGLTESRASKLALLAGLAVTCAATFLPILTRRALAVILIVCIAWPFAVQKFFLAHYDLLERFPPSWRARMEIWDYMSYRIGERPFFGWGLGTAHTLPFQEPHGAQYLLTKIPAAHAHNAVVELWVELGVPGLMLGVLFGLLMLRKTANLDARIAPFAVGAWAAALCLSLCAYNLWTDAFWGLIAMTAFAFFMMSEARQTHKELTV